VISDRIPIVPQDFERVSRLDESMFFVSKPQNTSYLGVFTISRFHFWLLDAINSVDG
jgi:hypothetical protein